MQKKPSLSLTTFSVSNTHNSERNVEDYNIKYVFNTVN